MGMKPPTLVCCDASLSQVLAAAVPSPDGRPRDFRLPCEAGAGTCPRGTSPVLRRHCQEGAAPLRTREGGEATMVAMTPRMTGSKPARGAPASGKGRAGRGGPHLAAGSRTGSPAAGRPAGKAWAPPTPGGAWSPGSCTPLGRRNGGGECALRAQPPAWAPAKLTRGADSTL